MRVAILSGNARPADAIGNQIAEKTAFFMERGAQVRAFVEDARTVHPAIAHHCQAAKADCLDAPTYEFLAASDLVVAEFGHYHSLLGLLPLCKRLGRCLLIDYHGITPLELWGHLNPEPIATALRRRGIIWYADAVLAHSAFTQNEILAATGFPRERTFVLGHPVNTQLFRPNGSPELWRRRLGLRKADTLLLFVGRIARSKRIDILIEALGHLPDRVVLAIAGDAGDTYALEAERCHRLAESVAFSNRVHWLGQVSDAELPGLYRAADVFVTASEHEGFCIPVAEALSSGTPVIAARAGALPQTVGRGGFLFTPGDAADLARQLQRVLFDEPGQLAVLKERALADVSRFARPHWREAFGRLVEEVLDMPRRPVVERLEVKAASEVQAVAANQQQGLVALRITNAGSLPVELGDIRATCLQEGRSMAAKTTSRGSHAEKRRPRRNRPKVALINNASALIMPGHSATVPVLVGLPRQPGACTVKLQIEKETGTGGIGCQGMAECNIEFNVTEESNLLQAALVDLAQLCRLPEGYEYEINGGLGRLKAWVKDKLLGGFRRRYVDVMSRQQSAANAVVLMAMAELNAKVERLERAAETDDRASDAPVELLDRIRQLERRVAELEETQTRVMT